MHVAAAQAAPHPPGPTARIASSGAGASGRVTSEHGEGAVTAALASVLQSERAALHALRAQIATITLPERVAVPEPLAGYEVEASKASDDDFLLEGSLP